MIVLITVHVSDEPFESTKHCATHSEGADHSPKVKTLAQEWSPCHCPRSLTEVAQNLCTLATHSFVALTEVCLISDEDGLCKYITPRLWHILRVIAPLRCRGHLGRQDVIVDDDHLVSLREFETLATFTDHWGEI
jgi:hypothetical protein